jgi:transposase
VDWAKDDHAVCVVGDQGEALDRFTVTHDAAGLKALVRRLLDAGVTEVGIERPDGPVVEALLQAELTGLVIPPGQLKNLRSRYGPAGNKDDRFDAYVLGDVVRTDRRRLRPLVRDSQGTTSLRSLVRARRDLVAHRVAATNQLRAHLQTVFPAAAGLFADIDSAISLSFLERFDTQDKADWLSPKRLTAWLRSVGYGGRTNPAVLYARLTAAPRGEQGEPALVHAATTAAFVAVLRALCAQIQTLAGSLACLAGVALSTRQSGKTKAVTFRWGADKQLRDALCDFAGDSRHANPWAADLYRQARARDHPHAVRILARAWVHTIWRCWGDNQPHDPARHGALQVVISRDQQPGA